MEMLKYFKSKNLRKLKGTDFKDLFFEPEFEDFIVFQTREKQILKMDVDSILTTHKNDLFEELKIKEQDKEKFLKTRSILRKADIGQSEKINLDEEGINEFLFDKVCHLMEQEIQPNSIVQSLKWYAYIEDNNITGKALQTIEIEGVKKGLDLDEGQANLLKELMNKIRNANAPNKPNVNISGSSRVGMVATGGETNISGGITVGNQYNGAEFMREKK